ncbi:Anti-sigma F factor antagonist [Symmachiella macrocystis]|uniref:Anti-sigma factor antagonist n=2 Tax=Symmachiella macrocystis TaxID=2527985 RepID=A0A5C6BQK8_9PLAN|nr:Anti-sigma F factor antagonist [Symmachiella macrocystis]
METMRDKRIDVAVLTVNQDYMDASNAAAVKQDILRQLDGRTQAILDLSRVAFVDSAGLSGLLACLQQVAQTGGDLKLCGITDEVRVLFDLIKMQRLFEIFDSTEQAVLACEG